MLGTVGYFNDLSDRSIEAALLCFILLQEVPLISVWWMRVGINSLLSSISAFSTDLKRIQTPHRLFWGFEADKTSTTHWSGWRVQVWAPTGHLAITPKGYSRIQSKILTAKSMAKLFGQCSGTAWAGHKGKHNERQFRVSSSCCWPQQARLRKMCYHSSYTAYTDSV